MSNVYVNKDGVPKLSSGQWAWVVTEKGADPWLLAFSCPCGNNCGGGVIHNSYLVVSRTGEGLHVWKWDGDWETPTLTPSIQRRGACNWHGYFTKGMFNSV